MHNARRNQTKNSFVTVDHQSVTRIVTAVETDNAIDFFSKPVNNLAFTFVAPLGADHDNILSHCFIPEISNENLKAVMNLFITHATVLLSPSFRIFCSPLTSKF